MSEPTVVTGDWLPGPEALRDWNAIVRWAEAYPTDCAWYMGWAMGLAYVKAQTPEYKNRDRIVVPSIDQDGAGNEFAPEKLRLAIAYHDDGGILSTRVRRVESTYPAEPGFARAFTSVWYEVQLTDSECDVQVPDNEEGWV